MSTINICPNCGHTLAGSNTTRKCYRPCKPKEQPRVVEVRLPLQPKPPTVDLKKCGVTFEQVFNAVCEHFTLNDVQIKRMISEKREHQDFKHIRYILIYLLITDLAYSHEKAAGAIERDRRTGTAAYHDVITNSGKYAFNMQAIRKKYYPKTQVVMA